MNDAAGPRKARKNERGIALVVVLWVGLLVAAIAGAFVLDIRTSLKLTHNFLGNAEARALADGGVHLAIYELFRSDGEDAWVRDGSRYRRAVPGGMLHISVEDEAGKIDINKAEHDLLQGVFRSAGLSDGDAQIITEAIEKYRVGAALHESLLRSAGVSESDIKSLIDATSTAGREKSDRRGTGRRAGGNTLGVFHAVDSLGQVPGVTPALFARLRPALTAYGGEGVHYLTAPPEALRAIPGMSKDAVDEFLAERVGEDPTAALNDFLVQGRARDYWQEDPGPFVTIKVTARSNNGAIFTRIAIVEIREAGEPSFDFKEWREGDSNSVGPPLRVAEEDPALSGKALSE